MKPMPEQDKKSEEKIMEEILTRNYATLCKSKIDSAKSYLKRSPYAVDFVLWAIKKIKVEHSPFLSRHMMSMEMNMLKNTANTILINFSELGYFLREEDRTQFIYKPIFLNKKLKLEEIAIYAEMLKRSREVEEKRKAEDNG